jgi:hypothetical protein
MQDAMKESLNEFKLVAKFQKSQTREMVMNLFGEYYVMECERVSNKKFILTFKYRDTMMRALK